MKTRRHFLILTMLAVLVISTGDAFAVKVDFDGDGRQDFVTYRPSTGNWYIYPSSYPVTSSCPPCTSPTGFGGCTINWGLGGSADIPKVGDFNGDGRSDLAIWRPAAKSFFVKMLVTPAYCPEFPNLFFSAAAGQVGGISPGDFPDVADVTGDGFDDLMVLTFTGGGNPSWQVRSSSTQLFNTFFAGSLFPEVNVVPVSGEFSGAGLNGYTNVREGAFFFKNDTPGCSPNSLDSSNCDGYWRYTSFSIPHFRFRPTARSFPSAP